ncbi:MAG: hypothetical protein EPN23_06640 [Verrucomicrobia bacterium]|nr:MAG: hypothetical protein EPN23_06640 [Verrucomicrobiota bacterium]
MKPTETLEHDHELILQVIDAAVQEVEKSSDCNWDKLEQMLDFFVNFADRCHHAKEENLLFPRLAERGLPRDGGPLGVMLMEHVAGRGYLKTTREALPKARQGDKTAGATARKGILDYAELLRAHIHKENMVLFHIANELLTAADQRELTAAFETADPKDLGPDAQARYHALAQKLTGKH